jgi:hypothetical protein
VNVSRIPVIVFVFALLSAGAVQSHSQSNKAVEDALKAKEQVGWQSWKDHNAKPVDEMTPDEAINIADGVVTKGKQKILSATMSTACDVKSFSLSDFSFLWLDKDSVVITYTATQDATCSGKKQNEKVIASSLWQRKSGKWVSPFHQETDRN